jgi:hypothetical protein
MFMRDNNSVDSAEMVERLKTAFRQMYVSGIA